LAAFYVDRSWNGRLHGLPFGILANPDQPRFIRFGLNQTDRGGDPFTDRLLADGCPITDALEGGRK
jgi:hypothetical protein